MKPETSTPSIPPTTQPARRKRKSTPRAPRVVDPDVVAIRKAATEQVAQLHQRRRSASILATLLDKRLAQMTADDQHRLYDALGERLTPLLPKLLPEQKGAVA